MYSQVFSVTVGVQGWKFEQIILVNTRSKIRLSMTPTIMNVNSHGNMYDTQ